MSNTVLISKSFQREAKQLLKRFVTLKQSIADLTLQLIDNPYCGDYYGSGIYKVRLADKSKGKGKSGGFRVMYYHLSKTENGIEILLISIFDKSDMATITKTEAIQKLKAALRDRDD